MEKAKLQIEYNNFPYKNGMIYAALSLRGGYVTRNYIAGNSQFESNCAFFNILFNYYRLTSTIPGLHYDVQRGVSTISFGRNKAEVMPALADVLHFLFRHEYDSDKFNIAKRNTSDAFASRYREGAFRAKYKGYEFSDLNKRFTLQQLIRDIETITFEDFVRIANVLVVPGNVSIYLSGEITNLDFSTILLDGYEEQNTEVRIAGYGFDPYLRQDAHITNIAREDYNGIIEAVDFLNADCTNFTKLLIMELLAELIPAHETDIWVDSLDASIMFPVQQLRSYKAILRPDNKNTYTNAHKSLLTKYISLLENGPEQFAMKAANMMSIGVYIDQYLNFLDQCSYELFVELCQKADYKISEAQIVLRKETR